MDGNACASAFPLLVFHQHLLESAMVRETCVAALLLLSGLCSDRSLAQYRAELPYPVGSDVTSQWTYSCPSSRCAFSCPGAGGASHVTKLTIFMGRMHIGSDQSPFALFYEYSTKYIQRGNGFTIDTGLGTLACQVSGMKLDYSGPPRSPARE
jgi:hypothetical protein